METGIPTSASLRSVTKAAGIAPYAVSIFTSAILLFLIQPMIAKQLLPWFGGAAAVWTACMMFFQIVLLFGYLYAHWSIRNLSHRGQLLTHILFLALSAFVLWLPAGTRTHAAAVQHPAWEALRVLAGSVGPPYFVLSSTSPLLQAWYSRSEGKQVPYRLFALSNLGSLLALLAYPFAVEPALNWPVQFAFWRLAYLLFATVCGGVALHAFRSVRGSRPPVDRLTFGIDLRQYGIWIALSWCSSAFLLAVTNDLCQEIAPIPLLWIAPLAIYLLSFVLCFDYEGLFRPSVYRILVPVALAALVYVHATPGMGARLAVPLSLAGLFIVCMFCHGLVAHLKPESRHLTWFYLSLSTGGALGGLFVGLLAPAVFRGYYEIEVCASICLVFALYFLFDYRRVSFLITAGIASLVLLNFFGGSTGEGREIFRGRNFYGVLAVKEVIRPAAGPVRMLVHGGTIHGGQMLTNNAASREPGFYYGGESGAGIALQRDIANHRVGIVGLGVGTVAAYGHRGDYYRFYEINPLDVELARSQFTFLADSDATVEVVLGDARLSLESEPSQNFDTLILDAFSGDTIPVHLLTFEAFRAYFRHLKESGVIAVHVSNTYLNLDPVLAELSAAFDRHAVRVASAPNPNRAVSGAEWILITRDAELVRQAAQTSGAEMLAPGSARLWTDQYSNILSVLK